MSSRIAGLIRAGGAWALTALLVVAMVEATAREPAPFTHGLLFRIDAPGKPASWVFGTVHSNDSRVTVIPAPVIDALSKSRRLAPETLLTRDELPDFFAAAQLGKGRRLGDHFDAAAQARIRAALGPGAPSAEALDRLKPWAIWLMLDKGTTTSAAPILDELLVVEARARGMAVVGLELPDEQVASLDSIPVASQVAMVRWTLANEHRRGAAREALLEAWLARDLGKLGTLAQAPAQVDRTLAPHLREIMTHLVANRNIQMAHRLFLPLRDGRVFVAVGALHLHGPRSLLALIREQGYRVTHVY